MGTPTEGALWNDTRPSLGLGHGSCSGHGLCVTSADGKARCQCEEGLSGPACDVEQRCEKGCSGHGRCFEGIAYVKSVTEGRCARKDNLPGIYEWRPM